MATKTEIQLANDQFFAWLDDRGMEKKAADALGDFTRERVREDSFAEKIMPPEKIGNDQLDRQYWTDLPVYIVDKETTCPPAMSVPYGATPVAWYVRGARYQVTFSRIYSTMFTKDIGELRTWRMDIRQVMSDNAIKEMLAELDSRFISAVNTAMIAQGSVTPASGAVQWQSILGGVTRETWMDHLKIMPSTKFNLQAATVLCNQITLLELQKWGHDEWGGPGSQDILRDGWTLKRFNNRDLLITIKRDLVPDYTFFDFADPKFIGKMLELEPTTMWLERRNIFVEWFFYRELGCTIGHTGGLSRADIS